MNHLASAGSKGMLDIVRQREESDKPTIKPGALVLILVKCQHFTFKITPYIFTLSVKLDPLSLSRKVREGLADVISMHEMLTNQILLFHSETVATPWLQYVCELITSARHSLTFLEGERGSSLID